MRNGIGSVFLVFLGFFSFFNPSQAFAKIGDACNPTATPAVNCSAAGGETCYKATCVQDPCYSLPFSDNDSFGCEVAAALDLSMPSTPTATKATLLRMNKKSFAIYKKSLEAKVRRLVWLVLDYKVGAKEVVFDSKATGYLSNANIRDLLQENARIVDLLAVGRWHLPHGSAKKAPKDLPANRD